MPPRPAAVLAILAESLVYVLVIGLVLWPLATLGWEATAGGWAPVDRVFSDPSTYGALRNTLIASLVATPVALVIGGGMAIMLHLTHVPGARWLRLGMVLPLLIPPFVTAFAWVQAYGRAGLLDQLFGRELPGLFGPFGVTLLLGIQGVPLAFLAVSAALAARGARDLERAARAVGADALTTIRSITLPLLRPAFAAAAGLVYISSASDFGIPAVLGIPGRFPTVTTEIYRSLSFLSSPGAFSRVVVLATVLVALALVILLAIGRFGRGTMVSNAGGGQQPSRRIGRAGWAVVAIAWSYLLCVALFPLAALTLVALTRAYGLSPVPANWSLVHFEQVLASSAGAALARSFLLAVAAAAVLALLGIATAILARSRRWGSLLDALVAVPYAVPGSAVAIAVILTFNRWWYGTLAIILVAYLARFWALSSRPISGALAQVGPDPLRAARVSGAGVLQAWMTGVWPGIRAAVFAGAILVFVTAVHELTVSSLLYTPKTETIAVIVLSTELGGDVSGTSAIAVLLTAIVLVFALPFVMSPRLARLSGLT